MAKINHNNSLDTIDALFTEAKNKGIMHLVSDVLETQDYKLCINGTKMLNFGSCGYMGLESDQRLKDGAIDFIQKYGTQYGISRGFLSSGINEELENYLAKIFGRSVITYSSTSSAHISVIPTIIQPTDAVILDQQVHMSVQTATQLLLSKGTIVEMIRHSNLEMLERQLEQLCQKHKKVWYMIDGVYSMYGDLAPMEKLIELMAKYSELYLYIDDAHGMSWYGENGAGYANSKIAKHEKVMLMTTMGKGFGVTGGIAVFPTVEMHSKVRIFGGPLVYSHPLSPAIIGAGIASAKIHLSSEIYDLQNEFQDKIKYCKNLLQNTELTVISDSITPINFIAMGHVKVTSNIVKKMLNDGFFVSPALFPAVPMKNSGIRCSINRHIEKNEIKAFVEALVYHYPKALEEENKTIQDVNKAFKITTKISNELSNSEKKLESIAELIIKEENSILKIDKEEWNAMFKSNGNFDWDGLKCLESVFCDNEKPEENWNFHYYIVKDKLGVPVFATFFTSTILKDDMLTHEATSLKIEEKRKTDSYFLTSVSITMGCMMSEGEHYFIDRKSSFWKDSFYLILDKVTKIQEQIGANTIIFRDFDEADVEIRSLLLNEGFAPINMPNSNVITNLDMIDKGKWLNNFSKRNRKNIRTEVLRYENLFEVEYKKELTDLEAEEYYNLYLNVVERNRAFNMFNYPENILKKLSESPNWYFLVISLKQKLEGVESETVVAVVWCYKGENHFCPMIIGIDYKYNSTYKVYKQAIYQILKFAQTNNLSKVYLGLSADTEKHKFGAVQHKKVAFMLVKDNYNLEVIDSI